MGKPLNDLTGFQFGSFTVLRLGEKLRPTTGAWWLCQCKCGTQKHLPATDLVEGKINSCGCEHAERIGKAFKRHGMTRTRTYRIWGNMRTRCRTHIDYVGRGIKVCERWMKFDNFLEDMGAAPDGMSLDRIDNDKGYFKENCRWATAEQQMNNVRSNALIEYNGIRQTKAQWAKQLGIKQATFSARIKYGWPMERIMTEALNKDMARNTKQINADEAQLEDADGVLMTPEEAKAFVATLP